MWNAFGEGLWNWLHTDRYWQEERPQTNTCLHKLTQIGKECAKEAGQAGQQSFLGVLDTLKEFFVDVKGGYDGGINKNDDEGSDVYFGQNKLSAIKEKAEDKLWRTTDAVKAKVMHVAEDIRNASYKNEHERTPWFAPDQYWKDSKGKYLVVLEVSGIPEVHVYVNQHTRQLVIEGEHNQCMKEKGAETCWHREIKRTISLPRDALTNDLHAEVGNGFLMIKIPKAADRESLNRDEMDEVPVKKVE